MIKKSIALAALMSSLPLCAEVKLATTLNKVDTQIVKELSLSDKESGKISHEGVEYAFSVEDEQQEEAVVLNLVVSSVEEDGAVVERASRHITAQWEQSTQVVDESAEVTLSVVPSKVA